MPKKVEKRSDEGSDVGPSGGTKNVVDGFRFGTRRDKLHFRQNLEGSAGGIKFHRKGDQVKEHDGAPACDHDGEVSLGLETAETGKKAEQREPSNDLTGEGGRPDGGHAPLQWGVGDFMLDGVTTFVGGNTESSGGVTMVILSGENEATVHGVVVITEKAILLHNLHVANSGRVEDTSGGLSSRKT